MTNKNFKKIIILSLILFFLSAFIANAQTKERELEIKYPEIFGSLPRTVEQTILPVYVKYIFNFLMAAVGFIAVTALIIHGIGFLTSINNPEKLERARKGVFAVIFGLIILFSAWIILSVINPNLLTLRFPGIEEMPLPSWSLKPPPAPPGYANLLWRITEIADSVKIIAEEEINAAAEDIYFLTLICDCRHTQPLCILKEDNPDNPDEILLNYMTGECQALYCYSANETQPCPGGPEIKTRQKILVASLYEILYYKKRAAEEKKDFSIKLTNLKKQISHKEEEIRTEIEFLNKIQGETGKKQRERIINELKEEKEELANEEYLYSQLEKELNNLITLIGEIVPPKGIALSVNNLSKLPDQCLVNVRSKCVGLCQGGGHDTLGCFPADPPDGCKGKKEGEDNPCPMKIIEQEFEQIGFSTEIIKATSNKIIDLIRKIINL